MQNLCSWQRILIKMLPKSTNNNREYFRVPGNLNYYCNHSFYFIYLFIYCKDASTASGKKRYLVNQLNKFGNEKLLL